MKAQFLLITILTAFGIASFGGQVFCTYEVPKDGMGYGPNIEVIFPSIAIKRMCEGDADCYNQRAQRLEFENEHKARIYYGLRN